MYLPYATSYSLSYNLPDLPPLQNAEPVSGGVLGLPVRNLAVGAVVGFELSGDELELLEEDVALRADALRAQAVKLSAQAV